MEGEGYFKFKISIKEGMDLYAIPFIFIFDDCFLPLKNSLTREIKYIYMKRIISILMTALWITVISLMYSASCNNTVQQEGAFKKQKKNDTKETKEKKEDCIGCPD